jgi:hypothetical protein
VQYPTKQPSTGQLATRVDRETGRVNAVLAAERDTARDQAASAHTLALGHPGRRGGGAGGSGSGRGALSRLALPVVGVIAVASFSQQIK